MLLPDINLTERFIKTLMITVCKFSLEIIVFLLFVSVFHWKGEAKMNEKLNPTMVCFDVQKKIDGDNLPLVGCFDLLIIGVFLTTSIHLTDSSDKGV